MKLHWKVLLGMALGVLVGLAIQQVTEPFAWSGLQLEPLADGSGAEVVGREGPAERVPAGLVITGVLVDRRKPTEQRAAIRSPEDFELFLRTRSNGDAVWLERPQGEPVYLALGLHPEGSRARWISPFAFVADVFLALLKLLIVPLVGTSILVGVAGVGSGRDLGRLGGKTFAYYISTSLLAILVGQILVSVIRPGHGAELGLSRVSVEALTDRVSFLTMLRDIVPPNVFAALADNGSMLQIIFCALLLGVFLARTPEPHRGRVMGFFESLLEVVMRLAEGVLKLIPYGVFALLVKVVAETGLGVFRPLVVYMVVVALALAVHACVTLPLILYAVGRISPLRWAKAMAPALMTAFSTSSSSMTLPVTLETVERRGRVSNKITSFTLPLGATINMDGTALYECIGVIFLAQVYAGLDPNYTLTLGDQALVVVMALLASIGAAGIPSAGLVMMLTILSALRLPLEGAALLLAVDRPLDMMRTAVNVWSDSCGAAVIARSEGESGPLEAGEELVPRPGD